MIDFFNKDDLRAFLERIVAEEKDIEDVPPLTEEQKIMAEDEPKREDEDESLYSVSNFSI